MPAARGRLLPSPDRLPPPAEELDIMAMPTRETAVTTLEELLALQLSINRVGLAT